MIVNDDDFEVRVGRGEHRLHAPLDVPAFVARGDDDRYARRVSRGRIGNIVQRQRMPRAQNHDGRRKHPRERPQDRRDSRYQAAGAPSETGSITRTIRRPTIVAAASWPVTLAVVRNMSGMVSTPKRIPMPSMGSPTLARTGTMAMIEPPGIPGILKLVMTDVATTVAICVGPIATPY